MNHNIEIIDKNKKKMISPGTSPREKPPITSKHPFWEACVGSELRLSLTYKSIVKYVLVRVETSSEYKVQLFYNDGGTEDPIYRDKKDTMEYLKKEWYRYYKDFTMMEFIERQNIDMTDKDIDTTDMSEIGKIKRRSVKIFDSNPPSPNPQQIRKQRFRRSYQDLKKNKKEWLTRGVSFPPDPDVSFSDSSKSSDSLRSDESGSSDTSPSGYYSDTGRKTNRLLRRVSKVLRRSPSPNYRKDDNIS